ncbi:lactonase family protein [Cellulomonas sp. KRMCY2]|uniref:lactonase family protein n=1 Tax=Cellulomonas sp. KRMCY2 TaxID=1304865 RepID=UPI00045E8270|nr:lactonase family protein [Cellulomonas sp. KRMCY2]
MSVAPGAVPPSSQPADRTRLWLGTYPPDGPDGAADRGEGIWRLDLDPATGTLSGVLAAACAAPSFLALSADGATLYAVGETTPGTVSCFAVGPDGALALRQRVAGGGDAPCHLLLDPAGRALYVTNYGDGSVGVLTLAPDGGFGADVLAAGGPVQVLPGRGSGPVARRQDGPHAHSSILTPDGAHLLVADLGSDELRLFGVLADGLLVDEGVGFRFAPGTGPRHLAVGPGGHLYAVGELSVTVHVLAWDPGTGTARQVQVLPACRSPRVSGDVVYPAHIVVHDRHVLVSVRGADVLARFAVHDGGARLEHLGDVPVGGAWPRHFAVVDGGPGRADGPGALTVVAAQESGVVTVLGAAGSAVGPGLRVPFPACVVQG